MYFCFYTAGQQYIITHHTANHDDSTHDSGQAEPIYSWIEHCHQNGVEHRLKRGCGLLDLCCPTSL